MNKNSKILLVVIALLVLVIVITAYLNNDNVEINKGLNEDAIVVLCENGVEVVRYNMTEIMAIGETNFIATLDSSDSDPTDYEYTGVLLKSIFDEAGISLEDKSAITAEAADGFSVAVDVNKVLDDDNVYLAYQRAGEALGTKEAGGDGPYQLIISKDQFSQHWCKFVVSIDVK